MRKKHSLDEYYFDVVDSEEKSYWLGFILADGYVNERTYVLSFGLKADDFEHLEKLRTCLKSDAPIYYKIHSKNGAKTCNINICSKRLIAALVNLGVGQKKSFTVIVPKAIPENLIRHFWRGVVDGDGSIKISTKYELYLCGNKSITESFLEYVKTFVTTSAKVNPIKSIYAVRFSGNSLPRSVINVLYKDAIMYLTRKYNKAIFCINNQPNTLPYVV